MNFHFVDRILEIEPGKKITGVKHVTPFDFYLTQGFKGKPALMSAMVGEAVGQLCSWNVVKTTNGKKRSVAGIVSAVSLYDEAYIGDTILLEVNIESLDDQAVNWSGHASIQGKTILRVESSVGPCLPMEDFNHTDEVMQHLKILERPGKLPELAPSTALIPRSFYDARPLVTYDRIIKRDHDKEWLAQKNVSLLAPYFIDHFPKKPVFPVSILSESNWNLGFAFLKDYFKEDADNFRPHQLRRLKISEFIQPGDIFFTHLTLKEQTPETISLLFKSEINGKRFCICEAEFKRKV